MPGRRDGPSPTPKTRAGQPPPDEVMQQVPYYEFIVRGQSHVDVHALEAATGLRCTPLDRTAKLDGELIDRAALHGVIEGLYRLGLDLLAVERRTSRHAT